MPNGFPTRQTRDDFGPEPENRFPVRDPTKEMDGETTGRLMMTSLGALGQMLHRAALKFDGATATVVDRWEAWNPKRISGAPFAPPGITRHSAGVYTIAYAASYPDHTGVTQPLVWSGGGYCDVLVIDGAPWTWKLEPIVGALSSMKLHLWKWTFAGSWLATPTDSLCFVVLH
jgi:hypothetical protein